MAHIQEYLPECQLEESYVKTDQPEANGSNVTTSTLTQGKDNKAFSGDDNFLDKTNGTCVSVELLSLENDSNNAEDLERKKAITSTKEPSTNITEQPASTVEPPMEQTRIRRMLTKHHGKLVTLVKFTFLAAYFVYFGFAVSYHVGDERSWRLIGATILGVWLIIWNYYKSTKSYYRMSTSLSNALHSYSKGKPSIVVKW